MRIKIRKGLFVVAVLAPAVAVIILAAHPQLLLLPVSVKHPAPYVVGKVDLPPAVKPQPKPQPPPPARGGLLGERARPLTTGAS